MVGVVAAAACGGTIRHDDIDGDGHSPDDALYLALAGQYPSVGYLTFDGGGFASGVLIAPEYVLTAAHVADTQETLYFNAGSSPAAKEAAWAELHENWDGVKEHGWDIALVRLRNLVLDVEPAVLQSQTNEVGQVGTIVGWGKTGTGLVGAVDPSGTKRAGQNAIDAAGSAWGWSDRLLLADFDRPGSPLYSSLGDAEPLDLEYCGAEGDSGGGLFVAGRLAGIVSGGTAGWPIGNFLPDSDYGDRMFFTRVSAFGDWIASTMSRTYTMRWTRPGGGEFNRHSHWDISMVPGELDTAWFDVNAAYTVRLSSLQFSSGDVRNDRVIVSDGDVTLDLAGYRYRLLRDHQGPSVLVGDSLGKDARLTVTGGELQADMVYVGSSGPANEYSGPPAKGRLTQSGGRISYIYPTGVRVFRVGHGPDCDGTYELRDAARLVAWVMSVGYDGGTGRVVQGRSTVTLHSGFVIGLDGNGAWEMNEASELLLVSNAAPSTIGWGTAGMGRLVQRGGVAEVSNVLRIGRLGGVGTYDLEGGSLSAGTVSLGHDGGTGALNWTGGDMEVGLMVIGPGGTLTVDKRWTHSGMIHTEGGTIRGSGSVELADVGGQLSGHGTVDVPVTSHGPVYVYGGLLELTAGLAGDGSVSVNPDGTLRTAGLTGDAQLVVNGRLVFTDDAPAECRSLYVGSGLVDLGQASLRIAHGELSHVLLALRHGCGWWGKWDTGYGITSSLAADDPHTYGVGAAEDASGVLLTVTINGDSDLDGNVGLADYLAAKGSFGISAGAAWAGGDYDYDGDVDYLDYAALKRNYGRQVPAPGIGQAVPEPASFLLLAAGALAVVSRRRRA